MKHVMIDLETLGIGPDCVIAQVAAVQFCPFTGRFGERFNMHADIETQPLRQIDPSTVLWWMRQSEDARRHFVEGQEEAPTLRYVLDHFHDWMEKTFPPVPSKFHCSAEGVWSHGATFDIPILTNAMIRVPWHYRVVRDTRTLFDLAKLNFQVVSHTGVHHDALDDARTQAQAVVDAYKKLNLREI